SGVQSRRSRTDAAATNPRSALSMPIGTARSDFVPRRRRISRPPSRSAASSTSSTTTDSNCFSLAETTDSDRGIVTGTRSTPSAAHDARTTRSSAAPPAPNRKSVRRSTSRIRPICATDQSRNSWSCTPSTSARANSERNRSRMTPGSVTPRSSRATGNSVYPEAAARGHGPRLRRPPLHPRRHQERAEDEIGIHDERAPGGVLVAAEALDDSIRDGEDRRSARRGQVDRMMLLVPAAPGEERVAELRAVERLERQREICREELRELALGDRDRTAVRLAHDEAGDRIREVLPEREARRAHRR